LRRHRSRTLPAPHAAPCGASRSHRGRRCDSRFAPVGALRSHQFRCAGAPRPARAVRLCAGRSPGSRLSAGTSASRLAALGDRHHRHPVPPSRAAWRNGPWDRARRLQLRGQPRPGDGPAQVPGRHHLARSRFSPCGPPAH